MFALSQVPGTGAYPRAFCTCSNATVNYCRRISVIAFLIEGDLIYVQTFGTSDSGTYPRLRTFHRRCGPWIPAVFRAFSAPGISFSDDTGKHYRSVAGHGRTEQHRD